MKFKALATAASNEWVTYAVNILSVVIAILALLSQQPFVSPQVVPYVLFVAAVLNIVIEALRKWGSN
jgi:hypothetical protein